MIGVKRRYTQPVVTLLTAVGFGVFCTVMMIFYSAVEMHHVILDTGNAELIENMESSIDQLQDVVQDDWYDAQAKAKADSIKFKAIFDDLATYECQLKMHRNIMVQQRARFDTLDNNLTDWARDVENTLEDITLDVGLTKRN